MICFLVCVHLCHLWIPFLILRPHCIVGWQSFYNWLTCIWLLRKKRWLHCALQPQKVRTIAMSGSRKSSIARIFWFALLGFSLLLIWNSLPYFDFLPNHAFVSEKFSHWLEPLWRVCFYNHVAAGVVCLVSALLSFSTTILKRWPKVHRISGRVYVFSVCLLLVPTGLYMSFFAKGGILSDTFS